MRATRLQLSSRQHFTGVSPSRPPPRPSRADLRTLRRSTEPSTRIVVIVDVDVDASFFQPGQPSEPSAPSIFSGPCGGSLGRCRRSAASSVAEQRARQKDERLRRARALLHAGVTLCGAGTKHRPHRPPGSQHRHWRRSLRRVLGAPCVKIKRHLAASMNSWRSPRGIKKGAPTERHCASTTIGIRGAIEHRVSPRTHRASHRRVNRKSLDARADSG